jgi:hypothetical protein
MDEDALLAGQGLKEGFGVDVGTVPSAVVMPARALSSSHTVPPPEPSLWSKGSWVQNHSSWRDPDFMKTANKVGGQRQEFLHRSFVLMV